MKEFTTSNLRLLALGAALALPLTGCENEAGEARNKAEDQLEKASTEIQKIAQQGAFPTPMTVAQTLSLSDLAAQVRSGNKPEWMTDEQAAQISQLGASDYRPLADAKIELGDVQKTLASSGGSGSLDEQLAAQAALRVEVSLGLARLQLESATRSDARVQQEISLTSAHIDALLQLQSIRAANGSYDPASPLRQIESQKQDASARKTKHQQSASDIQKQIAGLQAQIDAEVRQTNVLGEQAAKQREAALAAPIDVRISKIEAAATVARQADRHQVAAAKLEAQVDVLQPDLARAQTYLLEAEGELKDLDAARARIKAREKEVAAEGMRLQEDLRKVTEEFNAVFAPLAERFENELMPQYDAATQAAHAALGDARTSSGGAARTAKVQQLLGQILWRQSMSIESFAQLVRRVADNDKALGRNGQDAAAADTLDGKAKEARDGAEAALREALDAIPESGRTDEETASNQQLATLTRQNIEYITGKAVAEVRDLTDLAETVPTAPIEAVEMGESPLALLKKVKALFDEDRLGEIPSLLHAKNPAEQATVDVASRVFGSLGRLDDAARHKFNAGLVEIISDPSVASQLEALGMSAGAGQALPIDPAAMAGIDDLKNLDLDAIEFSYDNSRTTAWVDGEPSLEELNFIMVDGQWYVEAPEMPEGMDQMMGMFLDPILATVDDIAARTTNGEFVDQQTMAAALFLDITKKVQDAVQKMIPPGMNPGGVGRQRDGGGG